MTKDQIAQIILDTAHLVAKLEEHAQTIILNTDNSDVVFVEAEEAEVYARLIQNNLLQIVKFLRSVGEDLSKLDGDQ